MQRGYGLVFTPHIAKRDLWFTSGHEENYADSMFAPTEFEGPGVSAEADELSRSTSAFTNQRSVRIVICRCVTRNWAPFIARNCPERCMG